MRDVVRDILAWLSERCASCLFPLLRLLGQLLAIEASVQGVVVHQRVEQQRVGAQGLTTPERIEAEHYDVAFPPGRINHRWCIGHLAAGYEASADEEVGGL